MASALVAFNKIQNFVSDMIYTVLAQAGREDLVSRTVGKQFMSQVDALELLVVGIEGAPRVPYARLKALADKRNEFAHGHFSSDDETGEMVIRGKGKAKVWDDQAVIPFLEECAALRIELSRVYAFVLFGEDLATMPEGSRAFPAGVGD